MSKTIEFSDACRKKMQTGVNVLADAVSATMGAKGRNVVIHKLNSSPIVTKDGVTVAKEIELSDPIENLGAEMLRKVASKTNEDAGDGTTTATVLAREIFNSGLKKLSNSYNPILMKRGMDEAVNYITYNLKKMAIQVNDKSIIKNIASISANNDEELGKTISTAIDKVGLDGVVTVEESRNGNTYLELVDGLQFDRGYYSPYFINNEEKLQFLGRDCFVLGFMGKLDKFEKAVKVLEYVISQGRPILIIVDDIDTMATLNTFIHNVLRGMVSCCIVRTAGYGDQKKPLLEDIMVLTGGKMVDVETGVDISKFTSDDCKLYLGEADKVVVDKMSTTIVNGRGKQEEINKRVKQIKELLPDAKSEFERDKLQERIAKLTGGVSVIYVGGASEVEAQEKKYRIEDALNATRASIEEGIVAGGGTALIRASQMKIEDYENKLKSEDEQVGWKIIMDAITAPLKTIVYNAGENSEYVVETIKNATEPNLGYNVLTSEFTDMIDEGVIDPVKVTRMALQNASSVAGLMLTTEVVVIEDKEENKGVANVS